MMNRNEALEFAITSSHEAIDRRHEFHDFHDSISHFRAELHRALNDPGEVSALYLEALERYDERVQILLFGWRR